METKKISKWDAAPESIKNMRELVNALYDPLPDERNPIIDALSKVLDDYNELEAKYNTDCGMISDYAEENARLKQKNEKASNNIRELRQALAENDIVTCMDPITGSWGVGNVALQKKTERFNIQLDNLRERLKITDEENRALRKQRKELIAARSEQAKDNDNLRHERDRNAYLLDGLCRTLADKGICCEWGEAALEWRLYGKNKLFDELREHYEEELRIREKEKDEKDKLIDELKLRMSVMHGCYGLNPLGELNRKIKELEKENKELKDTLNVDRDLGKYVGKCVADCIQEGWKNGRYELHPYTRFDIHVEETKNTSMSSNRYSIPNVVVALHNTQTEMERDTAQHECEELNEKVDRLWRVNDELNRKIKEFKKENKELKATLAVCAVDANTAKKLCNGIVSKVKRTRNNEEEN